MGRATAAAEPIPVSTMATPVTAAISVGQLSAQRSPAVPTRAHQFDGQPTNSRPAHGRALDRAPPSARADVRTTRPLSAAQSPTVLDGVKSLRSAPVLRTASARS